MKFVSRGLRRFLGVTWDEIEKAQRLGERQMGFELYDIMEEASIYGAELDERVEENIKYVLEREGLLPKGASVVVPMGALHWECPEEGGTCWYRADFEVFDKTGNRVLARGTANGFMTLEDDTAMLLDMTVWMPTEDVKRLKRMVEKAKALLHSIFG